MRVGWRDIVELLIDPVDGSPLAVDADGDSLTSTNGRHFRVAAGCPVLLPPDGIELGGWRFPPIKVSDLHRAKPQRRGRRMAKWLKRLFEPAGSRDAAIAQLGESLPKVAVTPLLLVVGGATEGDGLSWLLGSEDIRVVTFDIYPTTETTFVADAHRIPLADGSVDGVIVQAVLEHVYRPEVVVAEIERVVRPGGLVYSETPFLQPVHEGAFDFTRFTVSGHRLLFSGFDELAYGPIGGPGAMLNLACRGFVGGVSRSSLLAKVAYMFTLPLRSVDRLVNLRWRRDFAVGAYFLGERRSIVEPADVDPVQVFDSIACSCR